MTTACVGQWMYVVGKLSEARVGKCAIREDYEAAVLLLHPLVAMVVVLYVSIIWYRRSLARWSCALLQIIIFISAALTIFISLHCFEHSISSQQLWWKDGTTMR